MIGKYKFLAEEILEEYVNEYSEVDLKRVANKLEEIAKDTAKEILQEVTCTLRKYEVKVHKDNYEQFGFIYMVDSSDIDMHLDKLTKRYGVEVE